MLAFIILTPTTVGVLENVERTKITLRSFGKNRVEINVFVLSSIHNDHGITRDYNLWATM